MDLTNDVRVQVLCCLWRLLARLSALSPSSQATPKDFSEGHMLVYTLCTEAGQPKNAERLCYEMFLNYIRGAHESHRHAYPCGAEP